MKRILLLLLPLLALALPTTAQVVHITGEVVRQMRGTDGRQQQMPLSVPIYIFDSAADARQQVTAYRRQSTQQGQYTTLKAADVVTPDYEGHFEADLSQRGAMVVISEGSIVVVPIDQRLHYTILINGDSADGILLKNTDVVGEKRGLKMRELPAIDDGPTVRWDVTLSLPEGYITTDTRLILQPVVIDCQTEDTIQYLEPVVGEGERYHRLQQRYKSFDYQRHDPLAPYYRPDLITDGTVHWTTTFTKPHADHTYKWQAQLRLEDYSHIYYDDASKEGSCNSRKPWAMLDISMARKEMAMSKDFYEPSRAQLTEAARDLQLTFAVGTSQLTGDSINSATIRQLARELQSYGRQLINVKIQGTASPDGNAQRNAELASQRAAKALSLIIGYARDVSMQTIPAKVYTWSDVADSLIARGQRLEGEELRQYAQTGNQAGISRMMESNPAVDEILQHQRVMKCAYLIRQNKVLEPDEALWVYRNDPSYAEGGDNKFSNGDYYNLLTLITDSAERRRLIHRIYREQSQRSTSRYSPFAAYIANSVACYTLDADSTDTSILRPFCDLKSGLEVSRQIAFDNAYRYTVNRREVVANQAVMLFRDMKLNAAAHMAAKLPDTPEYRDVKMFTDLETLFFKQQKSADEERRARRALQYVMASSLENRAVLTYELAPELGYSYQQAERVVDSLDADNAKRWYMKAMIAANTAANSETDFMELVNQYGVDEALRRQENTTPLFLAYLQRAFDLDSSMKQLYATDVHLTDDQRKQHPYDPAKATAYRKKFKDATAYREKFKDATAP